MPNPVMRRRISHLAGTPWTPASLGANLKGWWKSDAGVKARTAALFTAANSETLSRADEAALRCGDIDFYWAGWFLFTALPASYTPLPTKGATVNQLVNYAMYQSADGKPRFTIGDGITNKTAAWGSALSTATWYWVEGYHDSVNDVVGICVNRGTDVTAATAGVVPASGNTGALTYGKDTGGAYFGGRAGSCVFFKRIPTAAERNALYNSGNGLRYSAAVAAGVSLTSLIGWWEMDENSGSRADKSGNALTLTDGNTVTADDGKVEYDAAEGDFVWKWTDQGSVAGTPSNATFAARPTYKANIINGRPVIRGDGVDDILVSATSLAYPLIAPMTIVAVIAWKTLPAANQFVVGKGLAGGTGWALSSGVVNTTLRAKSLGVKDYDFALQYVLDTFAYFEVPWDAAFDITLYKNGVSQGQVTHNADMASTTNALQLFGMSGGAYANIDIAEVLVYDGLLTPADRAGLAAYMTARYGL